MHQQYPRKAPAARCGMDDCDCPDYTHDYRRGPVCDACNAPWPVFEA